ncbi:MAG: hypothetical protein HY954_11105 [Deltaproteobacteria bacterium]|nr:hypothetical protein [Deltaproteobacteria bacterium]
MSDASPSKLKHHIPFVILLILLGAYLGLKTLPEEGWSGWGEPSAQTLLTLEHWANDGIINHKFLYLPIGYSKTVQYLDDPELRQHARGTVTGYLIGRRLYYTHYPSGFVLPYAFLRKAGVTERHAFRLLSLGFSFGGLILLYVFLNRISTPLLAFFGVLYYGASTMFLDFADTLNNQPLDDLLRFAILAVSISALSHTKDGKKYNRYVFFTWLLYLLLSVSSYDSTFFIYAWLIGLDIFAFWTGRLDKPLHIGKWALYATAPVIGFSLQMIQNWWYLGTEDLLLDLKGVLQYRTGGGAEGGGLIKHIKAVFTPLILMTGIKTTYSLPLAAFLAAVFAYVKSKTQYRWPEFRIFILLLIAGSIYTFLFAKTDDLNYQGRQFAPALGLLVGFSTDLAIRFLRSPSAFLSGFSAKPVITGLVALSSILAVILWYSQIERTIGYVKEWPNHAVDKSILHAYKEFGAMTDNDGVIFYIDVNTDKDYPQPPPTFEYYAGKPVLFFKNPEDAWKDFTRLKKVSSFPFDAVFSSPQPEAIEGFLPLSGGAFKVIDSTYYTVLIKSARQGF